MSCPFCKPKERVLKENEHAYVMLSNPRKVEGHFLVIPKRHITNPTDITSEEIVDVFELVKFIQSRIIDVLGEGANVRQNYLPFVKDGRTKVSHMHYHVLPRKFNDVLHEHNTEDELWADLSSAEHDRLAKLLE